MIGCISSLGSSFHSAVASSTLREGDRAVVVVDVVVEDDGVGFAVGVGAADDDEVGEVVVVEEDVVFVRETPLLPAAANRAKRNILQIMLRSNSVALSCRLPHGRTRAIVQIAKPRSALEAKIFAKTVQIRPIAIILRCAPHMSRGLAQRALEMLERDVLQTRTGVARVSDVKAVGGPDALKNSRKGVF